jgi:mRNA interferase RelE/StbE
MTYRLVFTPAADRQLDALPKGFLSRLRRRLEALVTDPLQPGTKALTAQFRGLRRLRLGDYRVIYRVNDEAGTVKVVLLGRRRDVYDKLARMELNSLE